MARAFRANEAIVGAAPAPPAPAPGPAQPLLSFGPAAEGTTVLTGKVQRVITEKATGWRMILVEVEGAPMKWLGMMDPVAEGSLVQATGRLDKDRRDPKTEVFYVDALIEQVPDVGTGLIAFIARLVPGIAKGRARQIVERFGPMTIDVLDKEPNRLAEVKGVSAEKAAALAAAWTEKRASAAVTLLLLRHGVKPGLARRIAEHFEGKAQWVVENNPYRLTEVDGIAFKTADDIARSINVDPNSPKRAEAAVMEVMNEQGFARGDCFSPEAQVVRMAQGMIEVDKALVTDAIESLVTADTPRLRRELFKGERILMLPSLARAEELAAIKLAKLVTAPLAANADDKDAPLVTRVEAAIAAFEREAEITLAPQQWEAIALAARAKVMVLTGGPGTGKSTLLLGIIHLFASARVPVVLCAPTGRAAKKMNEATGRPAATIHRTLVYQAETRDFLHREGCPIPDCGVLIGDETSMTDAKLFADLLAAVPVGSRLILIGDVDQLPSVGPGVVLRQLIDSGVIPVVCLTQVFRQAEGSAIIDNAHRINAGRPPVGEKGAGREVYVIERTTGEAAAKTAVQLVTHDIPSKFGIDPREIQVLTPMHGRPAGSIALNNALQAALNPARDGVAEVTRGEITFRVGDRVLHKKNDAQRDVYNGDLGYVVAIEAEEGEEKKVLVQFDEGKDARKVAYVPKQLKDLRLAYAMSIHSAQGASFTAVVQLLMWEHYMLLSRPLLYTGFTRPRRLAVLITEPRALKKALKEVESVSRRSRLKALLQAEMGA